MTDPHPSSSNWLSITIVGGICACLIAAGVLLVLGNWGQRDSVLPQLSAADQAFFDALDQGQPPPSGTSPALQSYARWRDGAYVGAHFPPNGSGPQRGERAENNLTRQTAPLTRLRTLKTLGLRGQLQAGVKDLWRSGAAFTAEEQARFLNEYRPFLSAHDHEMRFHAILGQTAETGDLPTADQAAQASQMRRLIPEDLDKVRIAWATGAQADWERVPNPRRTHAALLIPRAWAAQATNPQRASALFSAIDPETQNPAGTWRLRRILIRNAIRAKSYGEAYDLAASHGLNFSGDTKTDAQIAELMAGWIALTYAGLPELADEHYGRITDQTSGPWIGSKAWRGRARALQLAGDEAQARDALQTCAAYQTTLYALLCLEDLEAPLPPPSISSNISGDTAQDPRFADLYAITAALIGAERLEREVLPFARAALAQALHAHRPQDLTAIGTLLQNRADLAFTHTLGVMAARGTDAFAAQALRRLAWPTDGALELAVVEGIVAQESQFRPSVASPAGAQGLMQLLPATAEEVAGELGLAWSPSLLRDPQQNVRLGSQYYKGLLDRYDDSHLLALSAYNAGPSRTDAWLADFGDPRTGRIQPEDWIDALTIGETRIYVQRVLTNILLYRAAEAPRSPLQIDLTQLMTGQ